MQCKKITYNVTNDTHRTKLLIHGNAISYINHMYHKSFRKYFITRWDFVFQKRKTEPHVDNSTKATFMAPKLNFQESNQYTV